MSTFQCECGGNVPLAKNHDPRLIGMWCGNCNQKYTFRFNTEDGQSKLWKRWIKCSCANQKTSYAGVCICVESEVEVKE